MRSFHYSIVVAGAALLCGCHVSVGADGGSTEQRAFPVSGAFTGLAVAGPYEVKVVSGASPSVAASGGQKSLDRMMVEVKDGTLVIHSQERSAFNWGGGNGGRVKVTVTVAGLEKATVAGSGGIEVDRVVGTTFKGTVAGSGDLVLNQVDAGAMELTIAGSGDLRASGKARTVKLSIAGSGDIDASKLTAESAEASIAGSGKIRGHATGTAAVNVIGSGDIEISGGAKCSVSKTGSGDVRCS